VSNFASKLWRWLVNRSPRDAAKPNVTSQSGQDVSTEPSSHNDNPFETYTENQYIQGMGVKVGWEEAGIRTHEGQLFRTRDNFALPIGCSHIVRQQQSVDQPDRHIRGIAGICFYCQQELLKALRRGEITPFDADRLSLVCSDCGKITVSGQLCCPKHYARLTGPDGIEVYLSPDDIKKQEQNQLIAKVLGPVLDLFLEEQQPKQQPQQQEKDNAQKLE